MDRIQPSERFHSNTRSLLVALTAAIAVGAAVAAAGPANADARPRAERAERVPGSYIVLYRRSLAAPGETTERLEREQRFRTKLRYGRALKGFAAKLSPGQVEQLREDPAVASVTPDRVVHALGSVPLLPGDSAPTGIRRIGAGTPSTSRQASSAAVAVLDTGIDLDHPDLN
ncbi:MAG: protease inhibitor I9 family protein, partial [Thermoleophilaceae bacterium]|nr:protease inhibitor I9 family protein [Thermoleophilaceae bacterium]